MCPNEVLATVASLMHIVAFVVYNKQTISGKNTPNISTWAIWAFLSLFNVASYWTMSGDWVKSLLPTISSLMCIATFFISLGKGRFVKISKFDFTALCVGLVAVLVWWRYENATYANLIAQVCIFIGFVPTYKSVWQNPQNEKPLAWFLWTSAYIVGIVVVLLRWNNQYQDIVYYADCIVLHLIVALLALRKGGSS